MMKKDCRNKPKSIFSRFFQRKQKDSGIDTSVEGFRYVGINLTEKQYQDLVALNISLMSGKRDSIPVFNMMILLKILRLLPPEMICDVGDNQTGNDGGDDFREEFQRKFGKFKE